MSKGKGDRIPNPGKKNLKKVLKNFLTATLIRCYNQVKKTENVTVRSFQNLIQHDNSVTIRREVIDNNIKQLALVK